MDDGDGGHSLMPKTLQQFQRHAHGRAFFSCFREDVFLRSFCPETPFETKLEE